jgi:hypothetical protein
MDSIARSAKSIFILGQRLASGSIHRGYTQTMLLLKRGRERGRAGLEEGCLGGVQTGTPGWHADSAGGNQTHTGRGSHDVLGDLVTDLQRRNSVK